MGTTETTTLELSYQASGPVPCRTDWQCSIRLLIIIATDVPFYLAYISTIATEPCILTCLYKKEVEKLKLLFFVN